MFESNCDDFFSHFQIYLSSHEDTTVYLTSISTFEYNGSREKSKHVPWYHRNKQGRLSTLEKELVIRQLWISYLKGEMVFKSSWRVAWQIFMCTLLFCLDRVNRKSPKCANAFYSFLQMIYIKVFTHLYILWVYLLFLNKYLYDNTDEHSILWWLGKISDKTQHLSIWFEQIRC
jgi:hypothetical protein